jgi:hypothetical protein
MTVALHVTPNGMPVIAYFLSLGLIGLTVMDVARARGGPIMRWLEPVGLTVFFSGIFLLKIWVIVLGAVLLSVGFGANTWWLQRN